MPPFASALPWLRPCCWRKGRAQELGGSIQPLAMDGCCLSSREGSRLPAGNTPVSGWRAGLIWHLQVVMDTHCSWCGRPVSPQHCCCHIAAPLSLGMSPGATSIRWTCGCPRWLPQHMVQGVTLSRSGVLVLRAHKPGHLEKVFARIQTGKASSRTSHHPSVPLGAHVCDQSLRTRLGHHTAHSRAPSICKESGRGSGFRVF